MYFVFSRHVSPAFSTYYHVNFTKADTSTLSGLCPGVFRVGSVGEREHGINGTIDGLNKSSRFRYVLRKGIRFVDARNSAKLGSGLFVPKNTKYRVFL